MMKKLIVLLFICVQSINAEAHQSIIVQSTTSTKNSGFYNYILPIFERYTSIKVYVVAVGTGAAIKNAMNCDGDVLLVHSRQREIKFVEDGYSKQRHNLMYNDYVLIGPKSDPTKIKNFTSIVSAFKKIAIKKNLFASRGDESGTHHKEKIIWQKTGINPKTFSGKWYRETGSGMGSTINVAIGMGGYTLTDRATWIKFKNKRDFKILIQGDKILYNQYGIMLINKLKCPMVKTFSANIFHKQEF